LFAKLKLEQPNVENKIVVVDGNLEKPGLDIDASLKQQLFDEVTIAFHLAATVSFNEPLR
jgi:thioester reductase-like protein